MSEFVSFVGIAHPWMCDTMGHMNVRYYVGMFDDASFHVLGRLSGPDEPANLGWADVRHEIDYKHETEAGTLLTIRSHVVRVGRTSVTYRHVMTGTQKGELHAISTITSVRFDLAARKSLVLDEGIRCRAEELLAESTS